MRNVVFSRRALNDLKKITLYLQLNFSVLTKNKFVDKMELLVLKIQKSPELFPKSRVNKYHKAVIVKQVSIFYYYDDQKINIVSVFDTRQHPKRLKNNKL